MDEVIRGLINQTVVGDPDVDTAEVFGIDPLWQVSVFFRKPCSMLT